MIPISIIICTYRRPQILKETLQHLLSEVRRIEECEVLVVDNNSGDETEELLNKLAYKYQHFSYYIEQKQGLNNVRNRGIEEASREYLFFVDDDALCEKHLFDRLDKILSKTHIFAIGGPYHPWYYYGKPRWFKDKYASKYLKHTGFHELAEGEYLSGSNMVYHRSLFEKFGPFDAEIGMKGEKKAYGGETDFQMRLKAANVPIYGDDSLLVKHIVQDYKLNVQWFMDLGKRIGKSKSRLHKSFSKWRALKAWGIALGQLLVFGSRNALKWLFDKRFYRENFLIETWRKPLKWNAFARDQWSGYEVE